MLGVCFYESQGDPWNVQISCTLPNNEISYRSPAPTQSRGGGPIPVLTVVPVEVKEGQVELVLAPPPLPEKSQECQGASRSRSLSPAEELIPQLIPMHPNFPGS